MITLRFKTADVLRCIDHALAAPDHSLSLEERYEVKRGELIEKSPLPKGHAALWLVKDAGIYLMSNGSPRDIIAGSHCFVAYAAGFEDGCTAAYDNFCDRIGGDDFVNPIALADAAFIADLRSGATMLIRIGKRRFSVLLESARRKAGAA